MKVIVIIILLVHRIVKSSVESKVEIYFAVVKVMPIRCVVVELCCIIFPRSITCIESSTKVHGMSIVLVVYFPLFKTTLFLKRLGRCEGIVESNTHTAIFGSTATAVLSITMGSKSVHYFLEWFPAIV